MSAISQDYRQEKVAVKERYKICPECGNFCHVSERIDFCIVCGAEMIIACPTCSEPVLYPTARYCPACGKGLRKPNEKDEHLPG